MASLGSNNIVLSLKVWIQKTDATSETKVGRKLLRFPPTRLKYIESEWVLIMQIKDNYG